MVVGEKLTLVSLSGIVGFLLVRFENLPELLWMIEPKNPRFHFLEYFCELPENTCQDPAERGRLIDAPHPRFHSEPVVSLQLACYFGVKPEHITPSPTWTLGYPPQLMDNGHGEDVVEKQVVSQGHQHEAFTILQVQR